MSAGSPMRLIGLTLARTAEGIEMRARYGYDPQNPPGQDKVKSAIFSLLADAKAAVGDGNFQKAGLQREGFTEEKATMSFVEKQRSEKGE